MRISVASDHAGFELKEAVKSNLADRGIEVVDCGTDSDESADYPLYAGRAAKLVSEGEVDRAVLVCGSGAGVTIVANKFDHVRAVNAADPEAAEMSRRHNDANVLCLAGRRLGVEDGIAIVDSWLEAEFEGGRHQARIDQINQIERE